MRRMTMSVLAGAVAAASLAEPAAAQTTSPFEVGMQVPVEHIGELDATDAGIGVRAAWNIFPLVGVEGELNLYPADVPDDPAISGSRTEGLFGITVGPRFTRWRPFVRVRPGFLRVGSAPEPIACSLIFPPTTSCTLSAGATLFALDVGGGVEFSTTARTLVRIDVGDRMVRYPGPARSEDGEVHDDDFAGHDVRVAIGAGWRF